MTLLDQIIISVITSIVTAGFAYLGFWRKAKIDLQKEFENKFNDRKWENYIKNIALINLYFEESYLYMTSPDYRDEKFSEESLRIQSEINKVETQVEFEILLVGSRRVVDSYILWKESLLGSSVDDSETFEHMIDCINEMRKDLGLEKSTISYEIFDKYYYISKKTHDEGEKIKESREK